MPSAPTVERLRIILNLIISHRLEGFISRRGAENLIMGIWLQTFCEITFPPYKLDKIVVELLTVSAAHSGEVCRQYSEAIHILMSSLIESLQVKAMVA